MLFVGRWICLHRCCKQSLLHCDSGCLTVADSGLPVTMHPCIRLALCDQHMMQPGRCNPFGGHCIRSVRFGTPRALLQVAMFMLHMRAGCSSSRAWKANTCTTALANKNWRIQCQRHTGHGFTHMFGCSVHKTSSTCLWQICICSCLRSAAFHSNGSVAVLFSSTAA
jgi:hypothetical protein